MAARQEHGFKFEKLAIEKFNLIKDENHSYTEKWDAYQKDGTPVSIKCIKNGSGIDLGDLPRQASIDKDFILIVGFWSEEKSNIVNLLKVYIDVNKWRSYFGNISIIPEMLLNLQNISNDPEYDYDWKLFRQKYRKLYFLDRNPIVTPRFKRDSKTQKRIQCGISRKRFEYIIKENKILWQEIKNILMISSIPNQNLQLN